jgi:alkanesulfonate monooxygenase SsuD/methylene tetrahydromethanopterin reductase-like flavin-dependent oxidoreductase (luciferase family)
LPPTCWITLAYSFSAPMAVTVAPVVAAVADQLERLRDATEADELIITTITHDHADRVRSYQLLAAEWDKR